MISDNKINGILTWKNDLHTNLPSILYSIDIAEFSKFTTFIVSMSCSSCFLRDHICPTSSALSQYFFLKFLTISLALLIGPNNSAHSPSFGHEVHFLPFTQCSPTSRPLIESSERRWVACTVLDTLNLEILDFSLLASFSSSSVHVSSSFESTASEQLVQWLSASLTMSAPSPSNL